MAKSCHWGMGQDVERLKLEMAVVPEASHSVKEIKAQEVLMRFVADFTRRM